MLYYILRIEDNTNIVPEYGAFGCKKDVDNFITKQCSVFGTQIVYNKDNSVVYVRREKWQEHR